MDSKNNKSDIGLVVEPDATVKIKNYIYNPPKKMKTKHCHLPPSSDTFKGRDKELEDIDSLLFQKNIKKLVICGLPGVGKSSLATQFGRKCERVEYVFWINAEQREDIIQSFKNISDSFDFRQPDDENLVKSIFENFKDNSCLFIYDNVLSKKTIEEFELPDNFHLIITSQENEWNNEIESIHLEALLPTDAVQVITACLKQKAISENHDLYNELADIMGNIPLALQISAAYFRESITSKDQNFYLKKYVEKIRKTHHKYINMESPQGCNSAYVKSMYGTVEITFEKIKEHINLREIALNVLYICSYLNPEYIKCNVLLRFLENLLIKRSNEKILKKALTLLDKYSIISYSHDRTRIKIHRFLHEILLFHLNEFDPQMKTKCYNTCLEMTCSDSYRPFDLRDSDTSSTSSYETYSDCSSEDDDINMDTDEEDAYILNNQSIYRHADTNLSIFWEFYEKHRKPLLSVSFKNNWKFETMLTNLVACACTQSLEKILEDIGCVAEEYVLVFNLEEHVSGPDQENTLKLLQKYEIDANVAPAEKNTDRYKIFRFINSNGENLLHVGAAKINYESVNFLISKVQLDVNKMDSKRRTPLHSLVYQLIETDTHVDRCAAGFIAMLLSSNGAKLDIKDDNDMTPKELLKREEKLDYIEIFMYLDDKFEKELSKLLEDLGDRDRISKYINDLNMLHYVAMYNHVNILKVLLKYNVNINKKNGTLNTALHIASMAGHLETIKILVQHKPDLNALNDHSKTPAFQYLECLSVQQSTEDEIIEILNLLTPGDIKKFINGYGETLLHVGITSFNIPLINILITIFNFDVNQPDLSGRTAVHAFIYNLEKDETTNKEEICEIAKILKKNGALLHIKDKDGKTPKKLAKEKKLNYILKLL